MGRKPKPLKKLRRQWIAPLIVVVLGIIAYCNCFTGVYLFDDIPSVRDNPDFTGIATSADPLSPRFVGAGSAYTTLTSRPILWLSFRIESVFTDRSLYVLHTTNLLIHLCCALLLYAIVRRNLSRKEYWGDRFSKSAPWLAAAVASIWVIHPLNTESVTYIVQRAESLAALFYLATIYCLIRAADDSKQFSMWGIAAIAFCAIGIASKETVATAPVVALIYDRTFLAGSFAAAIRSRWRLYAGLFATWLVFLALVLIGQGRGGTVNFLHGMTWLDYARTQLGAIAHYLRLSILPIGLSFNEYIWPIARSWSEIRWPGILLAVLVVLWLATFWKKPAVGFIGAWIFLILAPSSSFVPIVTEIVAEHRMYLPLMAVVAAVVVGGWMLAARVHSSGLAIFLGSAIAITLTVLTIQRNQDYHSASGIWAQVLAKQPTNTQALYNYGFSMAEIDWASPKGSAVQKSAAKDAAVHLSQILKLLPDSAESYSSAQLLGHMLIESGDSQAAEQFYDSILAKKDPYNSTPEARKQKDLLDWEAHLMRGIMRGQRDDYDSAKSDFQAAIAARPEEPHAHFLLGVDFEELGDPASARAEFNLCIQYLSQQVGGKEEKTFADAERELQRLGPAPQ